MGRRNRYSEGRDDGQMTPRGYPNFHSYIKNLLLFEFITDRRMDRRMEKLIRCGLGNLSVPPGKRKIISHHLSPASHHSTMNEFFAHLLFLLRSSLFPPCRCPMQASSASISAAILSRHAQMSCQERQQGWGRGGLSLRPLSSAVITIISLIPSLGRPLGVPCHGLKQWK
jgi:hypothetical protein